MKRFITVLSVVILTLIFIPNEVYAEHRLQELNIYVEIDEDGSALITEERQAHLTEGTENYIVIENIGKSKVTNFTVEEAGESFEVIDNWDIDASREEKIGKNGIIETNDGYELAWGIGEYGDHHYELNYKVSDLIKALDDAQILYWQFVNSDTNIPPENLKITIDFTNYHLTDEEIEAFGFTGDWEVGDGKLTLTSEKALDSSEYATVLIKFPENTFNTNDVIAQDYDSFMEEAESSGKALKNPLMIIGGLALALVAIILWLVRSVRNSPNYVKVDKGDYQKELPYHENPLDLVYLLQMKNLTDISDVFSYLLLKWMQDGYIRLKEDESDVLDKNERLIIEFISDAYPDDKYEKELYQILASIADDDGILTQTAIDDYSKEQGEPVEDWYSNIEKASRDKLIEKGYLEERERRFIFKYRNYELTEDGRSLVKASTKFRNYLMNFSKYEKERDESLDEIIMWSSYLGIVDGLLDELRAVYPNYEEDIIFPVYALTNTHAFSTHFVSDSSASGAGTITTGGGGGSFGGGAGGGTR